jgi:fructose-1,6-bisphosphatase/inositol monophosphatase family enzyme
MSKIELDLFNICKDLKITSSDIKGYDLIQTLWSGYGQLIRVTTNLKERPSFIVKNINIESSDIKHPKGKLTEESHRRKVISYENERYWYKRYAGSVNEMGCKIPYYLNKKNQTKRSYLILEDLQVIGFDQELARPNRQQIKACIAWLASFHGYFLDDRDQSLWDQGSYWFLDTRIDEWENIPDGPTKQLAALLDKRLKLAKYQTIIHGDAKLANFLYSDQSHSVAAFDFQYTGHGVGVIDLAYFFSSLPIESKFDRFENDLLDFYFDQLEQSLIKHSKHHHFQAIEQEWRELYLIAWADFIRFLKGWGPGHWKLSTPNKERANKGHRVVLDKLISSAKRAAISAGAVLTQEKSGNLSPEYKPGLELASSIVTIADQKSQESILSELNDSIAYFDLGVLTEESEDDHSRFEKNYFWCIDPLDGTLTYSEGKTGYMVSIALVSKEGQSVLGVCYNPETKDLYWGAFGQGSYKNDQQLNIAENKSNKLTVFGDRSFPKTELYKQLSKEFEINIGACAVANILACIESNPAAYLKPVKQQLGGGCVWDFAAATLILKEAGGNACTYSDLDFNFNPRGSLFFNHLGVKCTSGSLPSVLDL